MQNDMITVKGYVKLELGSNGTVHNTHEQNNLIVDTGKNYFANRIYQNSAEIISSIAIGTSQFNVSDGDTSLVQEIARRNIEFSEIEDNILEYIVTFPEGIGTGLIAEMGLFTNDDRMISRTVLENTFDKTENSFLNVVWKLQIA